LLIIIGLLAAWLLLNRSGSNKSCYPTKTDAENEAQFAKDQLRCSPTLLEKTNQIEQLSSQLHHIRQHQEMTYPPNHS